MSDGNGDRTVYLGAFALNAGNLEPVVVNDCKPIALIDARNALDATVAEFEGGFGMRCEEAAGDFSYACLNKERGSARSAP